MNPVSQYQESRIKYQASVSSIQYCGFAAPEILEKLFCLAKTHKSDELCIQDVCQYCFYTSYTQLNIK